LKSALSIRCEAARTIARWSMSDQYAVVHDSAMIALVSKMMRFPGRK
jgi:hypothetical protein